MIVEIISVGTELLLGNIVNTNASYIAKECAKLGFSCFYQTVVGDNEKRLAKAIEQGLERSDTIILTGGLGPTEDDLTKETVAKLFGLSMYTDNESSEKMKEFFKKRGSAMSDNNWRQVHIPEGGIPIKNPNGLAPGVIIELDDKRLVLLPGPPSEMVPMFEEHLRSYLLKLTDSVIFSRTIKICGISESKTETVLRDLIDGQSNPTIATYAHGGEVHIRLTASAPNDDEANDIIEPMADELKRRFGAAIFTDEEEVSLEEAVVNLLKEKKMKLAVAESCTGGLLAGRLINVAGASEVFDSGYVTYSDKSKKRVLGVKKSVIESYGAVSRETAALMAVGARKGAKADVSIAVTGIAGPGGETDEKPVGLVYIACFIDGNIVIKKKHFSGNRQKVRESTVTAALIMLRKCLLEF